MVSRRTAPVPHEFPSAHAFLEFEVDGQRSRHFKALEPHGPPLEGVPKGLRLPVEIVGVEMLDPETGVFDVLGYAPGEVAPSGESLVEGLYALLPTRGLGVGRMTVLNEVEGAARLQDSPQFLECCGEIGDRAQRPRG